MLSDTSFININGKLEQNKADENHSKLKKRLVWSNQELRSATAIMDKKVNNMYTVRYRSKDQPEACSFLSHMDAFCS